MWARMKRDFRNKLTELKLLNEKFDGEMLIKEIADEITDEEIKKYANHGWKHIFSDVRHPLNVTLFQGCKLV